MPPIRRADVHVDTPLSRYAVQYANSFQLSRMVTRVTTPAESDEYIRWEQNMRRVTGILRADATRSARVYLGVERDTFKEEEYALHTVFGSRLLADQNPAFDIMNQGGASLLSLVRLEYEFQIFTLLTTDANYASGHTVTLTNPWSDFVNGDPQGDILAGLLKIGTSCGELPPGAVVRMALPWAAWNTLSRQPDVLESVKYTHKEGQPVAPSLAAQFFQLNEIIPSKAVLGSAVETPDALIDPTGNALMWPIATDQAILAVVNEGVGGAPPNVASFSGVTSFGTMDETLRRWANNEELASAKGAAQFMEASMFFVLKIPAVDTKASGKGIGIYQIKNIN